MLTRPGSTPREDGFYMPAEWYRHTRTWMLWPQRPDNWRLRGVPAQGAFAAVATAIAAFEPVTMGVNPEGVESARSLLPERVKVMRLPSNDAWIRDCGPTFVVNARGELRLVHWQFNAWGGLYTDWSLDAAIPTAISEMEGIKAYEAPLIMEGGSIHVDGEGTLLTTEECLLNPNRNPQYTRQEIETFLTDYTGTIKILWLGAGIYNDETNGHIDNIACFLHPGLVALAWTDDHNDPQYPISQDAYQRLKRFTDAKGRRLEVIKIHQPEPIYITSTEAAGVISVQGTYPRQAGDRMAASYVNFYLCNGAAIMPLFDDPHDHLAMKTLQDALPGRTVIGVHTREILLGGGNIHCITQQQPVRAGAIATVASPG
jgi:agmatine deiminase